MKNFRHMQKNLGNRPYWFLNNPKCSSDYMNIYEHLRTFHSFYGACVKIIPARILFRHRIALPMHVISAKQKMKRASLFVIFQSFWLQREYCFEQSLKMSFDFVGANFPFSSRRVLLENNVLFLCFIHIFTPDITKFVETFFFLILS